MGLFVKICGVTTAQMAEVAAQAGADAIGVNLFEKSRRFVPLAQCAPWLRELAGRVLRVAVVVNPSAEMLASVREAGVFDTVQFHGEETPEFCAACGFPMWIRAWQAQSPEHLQHTLHYQTLYLLLDAWSPRERGGTGHLADWSMVAAFTAAHPHHRVILAGGLTPENVAAAVHSVRPFGVDVASGVESAPGLKDPGKVRAFVDAARGAAASR